MLYRKNRASRKDRKNAMSRKNRASRKDRASRKNRNRKTMMRKNRANRKDRKTRKNCWSGGMSPVDDNSMAMAQKNSLSQGSQYLNLHKGQYGGSAAYPTAVTGSVLTGSLITAARTGPLDTAMAQIQGMQDGGNRRSHSGKKHRKTRGGSLAGASLSENPMLLPAGMDKQAALHNEWAMAKDPSAFAPKA
jgi:hypothetical protein